MKKETLKPKLGSARVETIFLLLPTGITVRNFLSTGVIDQLLAEEEIRVVVFTFSPISFEQYQAVNKDLIIETFIKRRAFTMANFLHIILRRRFYRTHETTSTKILLKSPLFPERHKHLVELLLSQPFPRSKKIYNWFRVFAGHLDGISPQILESFNRYQPSLVISTHPTAMDEAEYLHCAKKLGVRTIGMIKSWDNLTTKGYLPVSLGHYLVWNQVMQEEMMCMHQVSGSRVTITGVPQFDSYTDQDGIVKRGDFFSKLGLDPKKKTVLYATSPESIAPEDPEILKEMVIALFKDQENPIQIIARLHPLDSIVRYQDLQQPELTNLAFQVPGGHLGNDGNIRMLDPMFISDLRNTLFHSDVTINIASSISLDAVAMDKPVVNIAFDLKPKEYSQSCRRYYDFDHFQPILKSGATKVARNFNEFVSLVLRYLDNSELENKEREDLREIMCYKVDGQSSKRITDAIMGQLG